MELPNRATFHSEILPLSPLIYFGKSVCYIGVYRTVEYVQVNKLQGSQPASTPRSLHMNHPTIPPILVALLARFNGSSARLERRIMQDCSGEPTHPFCVPGSPVIPQVHVFSGDRLDDLHALLHLHPDARQAFRRLVWQFLSTHELFEDHIYHLINKVDLSNFVLPHALVKPIKDFITTYGLDFWPMEDEGNRGHLLSDSPYGERGYWHGDPECSTDNGPNYWEDNKISEAGRRKWKQDCDTPGGPEHISRFDVAVAYSALGRVLQEYVLILLHRKGSHGVTADENVQDQRRLVDEIVEMKAFREQKTGLYAPHRFKEHLFSSGLSV